MPSSQRLARLMVEKIDPQASDVIVELGPGTGVFTRELLARGVIPANLILVEFNKEFVKFLRHEFPQVRVVEGGAQDLPQLLKVLGQGPVRKIISGIPPGQACVLYDGQGSGARVLGGGFIASAASLSRAS